LVVKSLFSGTTVPVMPQYDVTIKEFKECLSSLIQNGYLAAIITRDLWW